MFKSKPGANTNPRLSPLSTSDPHLCQFRKLKTKCLVLLSGLNVANVFAKILINLEFLQSYDFYLI